MKNGINWQSLTLAWARCWLGVALLLWVVAHCSTLASRKLTIASGDSEPRCDSCRVVCVLRKLGVITQADLGDQDKQNVSNAFVERVRKGMDALTVRGEMDKKLAKEQEKFRDFATHDMLAAADKYDNGTTQVLTRRASRGTLIRLYIKIGEGRGNRDGQVKHCSW